MAMREPTTHREKERSEPAWLGVFVGGFSVFSSTS
jgi:hypothetical protein